MKHTFNVGSTVERISGSREMDKGTRCVIRNTLSTGRITLIGYGSLQFECRFFKLVSENDVKRKELLEAFKLLCSLKISYNYHIHQATQQSGSMITVAKMVDKLFPDNTKACEDLQAIIKGLEASLSEAKRQLFDLKGE